MSEMRIYVAGAYSNSDPAMVEENVRAAIDAGIAVYKRGHFPYVPHLSHYMELRQRELGAGLVYEDYLVMDNQWLYLCQGFLLLSHSPGADRELSLAQALGLTIYESTAAIPDIHGDPIDSGVKLYPPATMPPWETRVIGGGAGGN